MSTKATKKKDSPLKVSFVRGIIEKWMVGKERAPHFTGTGLVFMFPGSDLTDFYIVTKMLTHRKGKKWTWMCSCPGFKFSKKGDTCKHIAQLDAELKAAAEEE